MTEANEQYYYVIFKFKGKAECCAYSTLFSVGSEANENQVLDACEKEAKKALVKMFSEVFPAEAMQFLSDPQITEIIAV